MPVPQTPIFPLILCLYAFVSCRSVVVLLNSKLQVGQASSSPIPLLSSPLCNPTQHLPLKPASSEAEHIALGDMGSPMLVPPWLESLLSTPFFSICRAHGDAARNECNMYCLDCGGAGRAFCYYCRSTHHKDHQVIQIRRSSYHDVVRVSEVQKALDISGVQTYVINSARVMFLNERPQPRSTGKAVAHICEICGRSLLDPFRFCSLGCKLVGIKRNGNASFVLVEEEEAKNSGVELEKKDVISSGLREGGQHAMYTRTHPSPPNPRRRKGVPQRSPLGT